MLCSHLQVSLTRRYLCARYRLLGENKLLSLALPNNASRPALIKIVKKMMKKGQGNSSAVVTDPYHFIVSAHITSNTLSGEASVTLTSTIVYFDVYAPLSGVAFIKYSDIYDIQHKMTPLASNGIEEVTLHLFDGAVCTILIEFNYRFSLCIIDLWQARLVQKCLKFKQMKNSVDKDLCTQYYYELLSSIRDQPSIDGIIEVLEEVTTEILADMMLKEVVFQSIDLILISLKLVHDLLGVVPTKSDRYEQDKTLKDLYPFGLKGIPDGILDGVTLTEETENCIKAMIGKRLMVIQKVFQVSFYQFHFAFKYF